MNRAVEGWRGLPERIRTLAVALVLVQVALVVIHVLAYYSSLGSADPKGARELVDFNQEGSVQTYWSAIVMAAAGLAALKVARGRGAAWFLIGLGFLWLGAEELIHLHEDIQVASAVDWPVVYLPALVVCSWAILRAMAQLEPAHRPLLAIGLGVLVLAVVAELLSSPSISLDFMLRNLVEENLELAGASIVLIVALAAAYGQRPEVDPAPVPSEAGVTYSGR